MENLGISPSTTSFKKRKTSPCTDEYSNYYTIPKNYFDPGFFGPSVIPTPPLTPTDIPSNLSELAEKYPLFASRTTEVPSLYPSDLYASGSCIMANLIEYEPLGAADSPPNTQLPLLDITGSLAYSDEQDWVTPNVFAFLANPQDNLAHVPLYEPYYDLTPPLYTIPEESMLSYYPVNYLYHPQGHYLPSESSNGYYGFSETNEASYFCQSPSRPYQCGYCSRSFARKHDLRRHTRVHTGDRPYKCRSCNKAFSRIDALKRHLRMEVKCFKVLETGECFPNAYS